MYRIIFTLACLTLSASLFAQQYTKTKADASKASITENIYEIKKHFLEEVLHNPKDRNDDTDDNDLERFNRWFNFVEPRCYPSGNMPRPDILLREYQKTHQSSGRANKTTAGSAWQPLGPSDIPPGFFGVGRVNCIVIDPIDTHKLYIGTACGGVWTSNDGGTTWVSHSDNFPSLSIADIAVNPKNTNILYAATGDGYGYETAVSTSNIFWGGLYSAGVMKSIDGGNTWSTTGLSYLQNNRDIIQRLLIHPTDTNLLIAATRNGIFRTTNGGTTWTQTDFGHVFSIAFRPGRPDTIYAVNGTDFKVSYNAGLTWTTLVPSIGSGSRCTIAVSPAAPTNVWVLDDNDNLRLSTDEGGSFSLVSSLSSTLSFFGYYDRVLAVSPTDPNNIYAFGMGMGISRDGGLSWNDYDVTGGIHPDNHAIAINPLKPTTVYDGNDGGIFVTRDDGNSWSFLDKGLAISQIYRLSTSRQNPGIMLAGLQDNGSFYNDGLGWTSSNIPLGDGMDNAIYPLNDNIQIGSTQYGHFSISTDMGASFTPIPLPSTNGSWISPVVFHPRNADTIYFGYDDIYASYDMGITLTSLTMTPLFPTGAVSLALSHSNTQVLYAADHFRIYRTSDRGATWTNIKAGLPSMAITSIAVDYKNPLLVYVTLSGYSGTNKVFVSTNGGATWSNISTGLPNLPVNCIAVDSTTKGALFAGTDIGIYYKDSSTTTWTQYGTGLPNVIVDDIDINYTNWKIRIATYGRGVWENELKAKKPNAIENTVSESMVVQLYPNPTHNSWKVLLDQHIKNYTVRLSDITGREMLKLDNTNIIDASKLAAGTYTIEVISGEKKHTLKAVKN